MIHIIDITYVFENKERMPMILGKQLGLNESCFERTVYVKQLLNIGENSKKKLINRISNVYNTGFDDTSLEKPEL